MIHTAYVESYYLIADHTDHKSQRWEWNCDCGAVGKNFPTHNSCEYDLDRHVASHAHEDPGSDSDTSPNAVVTDSVQNDVPVDQGSPQQSPSRFRNYIIAPRVDLIIPYDERWRLFTDEELAHLRAALSWQRMGQINSFPIEDEIRLEMSRRNLLDPD